MIIGLTTDSTRVDDIPAIRVAALRIIFEFGLCITKGDVLTDGKWCYVVLWVVFDPGLSNVSWKSLEDRLLSVCSSWSVSFYLNQQPTRSIAPQVYFLKFCCLDRKGRLYDMHYAYFVLLSS
ncbi:hypothetical protein GIB67_020937 [Kingdonia uniflora]|uniref:ACT domain-containing protein ACR n=1 Tax=Kingdonia uniflora TaxID=39325 RepID=A0A7J7M7V3_9MAGN|nr:hypothetical protein GIB67_020937 [Kingdonia uniflora]